MASPTAESKDPSFRQRHVQNTLDDHEKRITTNERWRLLLKGAVAGLAMANGADQAFNALVGLL